jgi:hypothetical protein
LRATPLLRCAGAPRDLGLDQGRAARDAIRADARAHGFPAAETLLERVQALRRAPAPARSALARDLARHFPHLAERAAGLAAGAGVAEAALLEALARELDRDASDALHCDAGLAGDAPLLRIAEPWPLTGFVVRECTPDGGYANLAFTRPAHVGSLAGVNEHGLAGVATPLAAPAHDERCAAPGILLLDQCIERLDRVEKALEWCEHRPGGGRALLVFADATGARAAIEIDGEKRQRRAAAPASGAGFAVRVDPRARSLSIEGAGVEPLRVALGART